MVYLDSIAHMALNLFKGLFEKKDTSVLGIDIGASSIKVVQLSKQHNKAVLETYGEIALGAYDGKEVGQATNISAEKLAQALKDLMIESKVSATRAGIAIPFVSSLVSLVEMPDVDQKQLETMVPIEARKYIPVPISEVFIDWSIIPKDVVAAESHMPKEKVSTLTPISASKAPVHEVKKIEIMIVAIHNDTITKFQEVSNQTALTTAFYEIEMFSSIRSLLDQTLQPVLVLDIGAGSSKMYVVERGIIRTSHLIRRGSQDITLALSKALNMPFKEAEALKTSFDMSAAGADPNVVSIISLTFDYVFSEANQVILNYEKKFNKPISRVVLIGGGVLLKGFFGLARKNFQIPVLLGQPFEKVQAPAFLEDVLRNSDPEFSVAVGLALRLLQDSP